MSSQIQITIYLIHNLTACIYHVINWGEFIYTRIKYDYVITWITSTSFPGEVLVCNIQKIKIFKSQIKAVVANYLTLQGQCWQYCSPVRKLKSQDAKTWKEKKKKKEKKGFDSDLTINIDAISFMMKGTSYLMFYHDSHYNEKSCCYPVDSFG